MYVQTPKTCNFVLGKELQRTLNLDYKNMFVEKSEKKEQHKDTTNNNYYTNCICQEETDTSKLC